MNKSTLANTAAKSSTGVENTPNIGKTGKTEKMDLSAKHKPHLFEKHFQAP